VAGLDRSEGRGPLGPFPEQRGRPRVGQMMSGDGARTEVGIVDPLPIVRRELRLAFEAAGFDTCDNPADVPTYLRGRRHRALVASLTGAFGLGELDHAIRANRQTCIVVLVDAPSPALFAELLRRGRVHPALRSGSADSVVSCALAAMNGMCALPSSIVRTMADALPAESDTSLTGEELTWFRRLADGSTIEDVAGDVALSERTLYRRLSRAYRKIGVETRAEAMVRLARLGLLDAQTATQRS
jgi:DNA-binding NarL/FixJ family response regulator